MLRGCPKTRIITFVGTVGSGKSTHMKLLASKLNKKGIKVKVTSLKIDHLFAFLLILILARILDPKKKTAFPIRALIENRPLLFKRLFKLWFVLDILSVSLKFLMAIYLPMKTGYTILVEEYVPAVIADYIYISKAIGLPSGTISSGLNFTLKLMHLGGPMQVIFLDAQKDTLNLRWNCRRSLSESSDYLSMQRTMLLSLSKKLSSRGIFYAETTSQSAKEINESIINHLQSYVNFRQKKWLN